MQTEFFSTGEHEILGHEYCSEYTNTKGVKVPGFYCPARDSVKREVFCCGSFNDKYCCDHQEQIQTQELSRDSIRILAMACTTVLFVLMACGMCICCYIYKKKKDANTRGRLYRMHYPSTASGVANMYSFSNQNSVVSTPLDAGLNISRTPVADSTVSCSFESDVTNPNSRGFSDNPMPQAHSFCCSKTQGTNGEVTKGGVSTIISNFDRCTVSQESLLGHITPTANFSHQPLLSLLSDHGSLPSQSQICYKDIPSQPKTHIMEPSLDKDISRNSDSTDTSLKSRVQFVTNSDHIQYGLNKNVTSEPNSNHSDLSAQQDTDSLDNNQWNNYFPTSPRCETNMPNRALTKEDIQESLYHSTKF